MIPIEYLQSIESSYQEYLKKIEEKNDHNHKVLRIPWNSYGDSAAVAAKIMVAQYGQSTGHWTQEQLIKLKELYVHTV